MLEGRGAALLLAAITCSAVAANSPRQDFLQPPEAAKPRGYWIWPHGNFDYTTIRRELAEFKAKGLGGVDIFDMGISNSKKDIPPGPAFLSPEQVDGIAFALDEAKRLGLKMGLVVSSSWNAGAAWTPPEDAAMNLVTWKETVTGPVHYERVLPFPELPESFKKPYGVYKLFAPRNADGSPQFKQDLVVLGYPLDAQGRIADPQQVRLLNDHFDAASGKLVCDLPAGRWVVMRVAVVNFGQRLWVPSAKSQGLAIDHFSKAAVGHHFNTVIDRLEARCGPLKDTALERLYLASYESATSVNWTPGLEEDFARQNGYRLEPFLPALYGVEIGSRETTDRFLYDYRHTVSELFLNNLYREARRICRLHGLELCSESGGPGAPLHDVPTEDLAALGAVDVMRGEFWNGKTNQLNPDGFEELQVVKPIASAAHIYGHRIAESEAFTSHINWREGPEIFKQLADRAYCEGTTRMVYHTMVHNLPEAGMPGWTYAAGSHMNTHLTWWEMSDQLHAYLARCSALLMQGDFVADLAYYYGHEIPNFAKPKRIRSGLGYGYDYDDLNTEILLQATVDKRGRIALPSGMTYAALVLPPDDRRMDLAVLQHLERLLRRGATVIGNRPGRTYGLRGYPADDQRLRELADRIWGQNPVPGPYEKKIGRGRIVANQPEREVLRQAGIDPDVAVYPPPAQDQVDYLHRRTAREEIYFLRNPSDTTADVEVQFRVRGKRPELWDAVSGNMLAAAVYQETDAGVRVPLRLPAHGSIFVVFVPGKPREAHLLAVRHAGRAIFPDRAAGAPWCEASLAPDGTIHFQASEPGGYELAFDHGRTRSVTVEAEAAPEEIAGSWEVRFPAGWDVPTRQVFEALRSWTEATNAATRTFSGVAVYTKQFTLAPERRRAGQRVLLDLGEVREVARVYLNGREAGISSFTPHVLDITDVIRAGENSLVVEVANTWLNRLIADDSLPEAQRKTHTNLPNGPGSDKRWREAQPQPSGLLGPVRLRFPQRTSLRNMAQR